MAARILVVDDDRNMRELLALHLGAAGYQVDVAEDPIAAGYCISRARPDLVISDINMPRLDGFEFVTAMREDPDLRDIPVIFVSTDLDLANRGKGLGVVGYLAKPVRADTLLSIVAKHVMDGLVPIG
jgi:two-component system chemotaxis response regulator CheY